MSLFDTHKPVGGGEPRFPDAVEFKFTGPGSSVEGTVIDLSDRIAGQYGEYRLTVLEGANGVKNKVLLGGVALDKAERGGIREGAQFAVRLEGTKKSKQGREYKDYSVVVVPPADGAVSGGGVPSGRPNADAPF